MIDLGQAIDFGDWEIPWERPANRNAEPVYERGNLVEPQPEKSNIRGKIQPVVGRDFRDMPEGIREEASMVLGTRSTVEVNDIITDVRDNRRYKVLFAYPQTISSNRTRAILGKVKEQ